MLTDIVNCSSMDLMKKIWRCRITADKIAQPTYKRQRFLLAFIRQLNTYVSATNLQKLVFLYTMRTKSEYYSFIPYKYGAYSYQLADDVDILRKNGYVSKVNSEIRAIGSFRSSDDFEIACERGNALIRRAYKEYPYYAINSKITHRLFCDVEAKLFLDIKDSYKREDRTLFTIGYEGQCIEDFINTLIKNDVHLLCDVRKNPISRKFGFSKSKLNHIIETIGIKYVHIPELGIESDKRRSLSTDEDYQQLFCNYNEALQTLTKHLETLYNLIIKNSRVAIMCYENDPERCHRHVIRDYMINSYAVRGVDL